MWNSFYYIERDLAVPAVFRNHNIRGGTMNRRQIREQIFKMLFRIEFYEKRPLEDADQPDKEEAQNEIKQQLQFFMAELEETNQEKRAYIERKFYDIYTNLSQIDSVVNEKAVGWKTNRMAKVDLSIIRLAVYEMKYEPDIPVGVAINEAVELAKIYSNDGSPSFVNGVLAKLV